MGMFDLVNYEGEQWQTSSLSCSLASFDIDGDGVLWVHTWVSDEDVYRFTGTALRENIKPRRMFFSGEMILVGGEEPHFKKIYLRFRRGILLADKDGNKFESPNRHTVAKLSNCARCGLEHDDLVFLRLKNPIEAHTHWALCPTTGEPILLQFT